MTYEMLRRKTKAELIDLIIRENQSITDRTSTTLKEIWNIDMEYSQENFILICLDNSNKVINKEILFKGGLTNTTVDIRVLFHKVLVSKRCNRFIIAHNHPSGKLHPSKEDINITKKIREGATLLSLDLLDHIIFTENKYYSFLEERII